jgi:cation transport protein ChaC
MREIYQAAVEPGRALTDEALSASLNATLAGKPRGAGWWVFAYGSLLWNPIFPIAESRTVLLRGYRRRFCLWSLASRGMPDAPGLVLGLMPGGACRGVAYRLPAPAAIDELHLLWRREMVVGSYEPRWVALATGGRPVVGLAFVVRRDHPQYAGGLAPEREAEVIATACGHLGSSRDYLERTRVALVSHGIVDPYLERVAERVRAYDARTAPALSNG